MKAPTVQQLRAEGWRVGVRHWRWSHDGAHLAPYTRDLERRDPIFIAELPSVRGGATYVTLTSPTGEVLEGLARCSIRDNYDKRRGVQIAIGRALKRV